MSIRRHNTEYGGIVSRGESGFIPVRVVVKSLQHAEKLYKSFFHDAIYPIVTISDFYILHFSFAENTAVKQADRKLNLK